MSIWRKTFSSAALRWVFREDFFFVLAAEVFMAEVFTALVFRFGLLVVRFGVWRELPFLATKISSIHSKIIGWSWRPTPSPL